MNPPAIFTNAWFIATISIIITIPISVAVTLWTTKAPDLTYSVYPNRTTVIQAGVSAKLRVLHDDADVKGNVTAVQIAIWNNGKAPIRKEDILSPVRIITQPSVPILEATIRKQSREVVDFSLDTQGLVNGVVPVTWKILEASDGAIIQLIYAGPADTSIDVKGAVVGQSAVSRVDPIFRERIKPDSLFTNRFFLISEFTVFLLTIYILVYRGPPPSLSTRVWLRVSFMVLFTIVMLSSMGIWMVLGYLWFTSGEPPFGF